MSNPITAEDADRLWSQLPDKRKIQLAEWIFRKPEKAPASNQLFLIEDLKKGQGR